MLTDRAQLEERLRPLQTELVHNNFACLETCQFQYLFGAFKRLTNLKRHFADLNHLDQFEQTNNLIINICRTIINIFEPANVNEIDAFLNQPSHSTHL
jgi:hypothetical protein